MSDLIGLDNAFQLVPLVSIAAAAVFIYTKRHYHSDMALLRGKVLDAAADEPQASARGGLGVCAHSRS
ncbi:hypothetical protein D3C75_728120 [compost metagenome]